MASVDNRVVSMTFDNRSFEQNVKSTIEALAGLDQAISDTFKGIEDSSKDFNLDNVTKAFEEAGKIMPFQNIGNALKDINFDSIGRALDNISGKFSVWGAVGFTIVQNLTNSLIDMGKRIADITLGPIFEGGKTRALNLEQAKFMFQGLGLDVEESMASALEAVKGTAYGLDAAAKVAAQFGGAGIEAGEEMTAALRGISGMAAMTGRSYEEIGGVMTGIAGVGRLTGQDLIQFGVRGLNVAAQMAKQMGITEQEVRQMVSDGAIDFKTFAALMDDAFGEHATRANEIYTGSVSNMRAALSRIGASIQAPRLEAQRKIFNALTEVIDKVARGLKPLIGLWEEFTEATSKKVVTFLEGLNFIPFNRAIQQVVVTIRNVMEAIQLAIVPVKEAFKEIFPSAAVPDISKIASAIRRFSNNLKMGGETADRVKRIFAGIFAALDIGWQIVKGVVGVFKDLFGTLSQVNAENGGILEFFADLGDKIVALRDKLKDGESIAKFFEEIPDKIRGFITSIKDYVNELRTFFTTLDFSTLDGFGDSIVAIKDKIVELFKKIKIPDGIKDFFSKIFGRFDPEFTNSVGGGFERLGGIFGKIVGVIRKVGGIFGWLKDRFLDVIGFIPKVFSTISKVIGKIFPTISKFLKSEEFEKILDLIQSIALGLVGMGLKDFGKGMTGSFDLTGGFFSELSRSFQGLAGVFESITLNLNELQGVLQAYQTNLKADTLTKIAIAIGVLTASILILSMIKAENLASAMAAMSAGLIQLMVVMKVIDTISASGAKLVTTALGLGILAGALLLLSISVKIMSTMSWEELSKGLAGVAGLLLSLSVAVQLMSGNTGGLIRAGLAMIPLAIGLAILAGVMKIFATMSWEDIGKGMTGVAGGLVIIAGAMQLMPATLPILALGLIGVGVALNLIAASMKIFATMSWEEMGKGLAGIGGGLVLIAGAMHLMPATLPLTAYGLVAVGVALNLIATSMLLFSTMSWESIGKGMVGVGGGLLIIAGAMQLMPPTLPLTAAGLILVGVALGMIVPPIMLLSTMSWGEIARGLGGLAGALIVLAGGLTLMSGAIPGAIALTIVAFGLTALLAVLKGFASIKLKDLGKGLLAMTGSIVALALTATLIQPMIPAMLALGAAILILAAGFALFGVGAALAAGAFQIIADAGEAGIDVLIDAIKALIDIMPELMVAFAEGMVQLAQTILDAAPDLVTSLGKAIGLLIDEIIKLTPKFAKMLGELITEGLKLIRDKAPDLIKTGLFLITELLKGIRDNIGPIADIGTEIIAEFMKAIGEAALKLVDTAFDVVINFLNGLADVIRERRGELLEAGLNIIDAIYGGILQKALEVTKWFQGLLGKIPGWIGNALRTLVQKGKDLIQGIYNGITSKSVVIANWFKGLGTRAKNLIGTVITALVQKGKDLLQGAYNGILFIWDRVKSWFSYLGAKVRSVISDPLGILNEVGRKIMTGLWNGLKAVWENIKGWFKSITKLIPDWKGPPSKDAKLLFNNGLLIMGGLQDGMEDQWEDTETWLKRVGPSISNSMNKMIEQMDNMDEFDPTITPVLDLTKVQEEARKLAGIFGLNDLTPELSTMQANSIAATSRVVQEPEPVTPQTPTITEVKFEQNNYSPEALSVDDIYRQTKSQIAMAKRELELV